MSTIILPVNKFYFEQVSNKELIEDYRAIKPYWIKKLVLTKYHSMAPINLVKLYYSGVNVFKKFNTVVFQHGYNNNPPIKQTNFHSIRFTESHEMTCMGQGIFFAIRITYIL